jgi:regulator of protease activity HflC (stomatin/prohibitin superfamily)
MNFSSPEKPDSRQKAYMRKQTFHDVNRYRSGLNLSIFVLFLLILAYAISHTALFAFLETYFPFLRGTLAFFHSMPSPFLGTYYFLLQKLFTVVVVSLYLLFFVIMPSYGFAARFLIEFYHPPNNINLTKVINHRLFGASEFPTLLNFSKIKHIIASDGEIDQSDQWLAWSVCNLGGPAMLNVFDGCALYLERGNRFSRVVGPGHQVPFLEWFETIKYVVDLRPKVKEAGFDVWTKDGIKVKFSIKIECRIGDPAKHDPASSLMYPYDPQAVKKAIERYALRWPKRFEGEPEEFTWVDAAWGQVTGIVPSYVGSRMLDDLFIADRMRGQILSPEAIKEIFEKLNKATNGFGVFITDFQILKIEIPKEVEDRQKDRWKAERQSIATIVEGKAKALSIRTQQKARADAQRDLILAIADGLEKNINRDENEGDKERFIEPLLLSFSGVLDESLRNPLLRANLAKDTLEVLEKLQNMLEKPSS